MVNNLPSDYQGQDDFGQGESCEACGDPLTTHKCSGCNELLDCDDCTDPDSQLCVECADEQERIGEALDAKVDDDE